MADEPKYVFGRLNKKYAVISSVKHHEPKAAAPARPSRPKPVVARKRAQIKKKAKKVETLNDRLRKEAAAITKRQKHWYD